MLLKEETDKNNVFCEQLFSHLSEWLCDAGCRAFIFVCMCLPMTLCRFFVHLFPSVYIGMYIYGWMSMLPCGSPFPLVFITTHLAKDPAVLIKIKGR